MKKKCQTEMMEKIRKMEDKLESLITGEDFEQALIIVNKLIFLDANSIFGLIY